MQRSPWLRPFRLLGLLGLGVLLGCEQTPAPVGIGAPAPALVAQGWLNGTPANWPQLAGRVVVIDVWAYW